jgi:hypothetical protein
MRIFSILVVALAILPAPGLSSAAQVPARNAPAERTADVDRIIRATASESLVIQGGKLGFDAQFEKDSTSSEALKALESRYPGILPAVKVALGKELETILRAHVPEFQGKLAALYAASLTPAELRTVADFYESPTGRRMVNASLNGIAQSATATDPAKGFDVNARLKDAQANAEASAVKSVTAEDMPALAALGNSTLAPKMLAMRPAMMKLQEDWVGSVLSSEGPRLQAATVSALQAYIAAHPPAPAK